MNISIVGHEAAKFTPETKQLAETKIQSIICESAGIEWGETYSPKIQNIKVISGKCHLGGVDIWAMEVARGLGVPPENCIEYPPANLTWSGGFKPRNIQIARAGDVVHCIVVSSLPATYEGMKFDTCYHCVKKYGINSHRASGFSRPHVKSGGCWTAWYAHDIGKQAMWHVIG